MREGLAFLACVFIWGSTWFLIEFQLGVTPEAWSVALRFLVSSLMLMVIILASGKTLRLEPSAHRWALGLGIFLFSSNYLLIYFGTGFLTSGLVAVSFSVLSLFNLINSRIFLGQRIDGILGLAAMIGVLGLLLIFQDEVGALSFEDATFTGIAFCVGATFVASLGNMVAAAGGGRGIALLPFNAWGMLYGAGINAVYAVILGDPFVLDDRLSYWVSLFVLAGFGTVLAFTLYLWLVSQIGLSRAAYVAVLMPLVALGLSTIFEGFVWTPTALAGVGMIVAGNVMIIRRRSAAPKAETT